jgi:hypothetical protein
MMDSKSVRNMESSLPKSSWEIVHLVDFYYKNISRCTVQYITMHGTTYHDARYNISRCTVQYITMHGTIYHDARYSECQISFTYSDCVCVALVIQHAMRMHHVILSSVACPALQYFSTLSHKRHDFREKFTDYKIGVLIFSTTFIWNISHYKNI